MKNFIKLRRFRPYAFKFDLKMKLSLYLFVIALFQIQASTYSQNTKVSLDLENVTIEKVFLEIEKLTEFKFFYNNEINFNKRINAKFKKQKISIILKKIFSDSSIDFEVFDKQIILKKRLEKLKPQGVSLKELDLETIDIPQQEIKGTVTGEDGIPLPGVNILVKGTANQGTQTDFDGNYSISVSQGAVLVFSYVGLKTQEILVSGSTINVIMQEDSETLDEVVLVSFGKQKKSSVVSSITTVKPSELKIPSSNLTTALAGRVSGVISYQRSGEPGQNNAEFFIRGITSFGLGGNNPLILIDGAELDVDDLARLSPDDIESFSIFKDASATALYGARGANGVIYVSTKEGVEGPAQLSFRAETSYSTPTSTIELADPITYMRLFNEATITRNPLQPLPFSQRQIENTIAGTNPILYPTVDWQDRLFSDFTINQRYNLNVKGGGKVARYFVSLVYSKDTGVLDVPEANDFNNNINLQKFQLRSNINISLSPTTKVKLGFNTAFDDYIGPRQGGAAIFDRSVRTSPVSFLPFYQPDEGTQFNNHILFGNDIVPGTNSFFFNPYADLVTGYRENDDSRILAQLELTQDLASITEGLAFKAVLNSNRKAQYSISRGYQPFWYQPQQNFLTGEIPLVGLNPGGNDGGFAPGTENLDFEGSNSIVESSTYLQFDISYNREFNEKHNTSGLLVFTQNNRVISPQNNDLQASLPFRNRGLSGRFTYGYDDRYFTEFNFGYNGSERFAREERWGFFPSIAVGWIASNEKFLESVSFLNNLKFKGSYGLVGNDRIGDVNDRFFYLSNVNLNSDNRGFLTGLNFDEFQEGVSISRYGNDQITWETGKKLNIGLELGLFNKITLEADYFAETRSNILADRILPSSLGLQAPVRANIGEARVKGIDGTLVYTSSFSEDFWIQARGNFTYSTSEITKIEEPDYSETPWRSAIGQPIGQPFGYIAERLFIDDDEVRNSPDQFGEYRGGDIKYKDINGDGEITDLDRVPIGKPSAPEIVYGFGFSAGYKNWDFSTFFQGSANSSFFINQFATAPFISGAFSPGLAPTDPGITNTQILQVWANSHWSENNRDLYARWPRLSTEIVTNNNQQSTWFINDGSFLRLKNLEIGFSFPESLTSKMNLQKFRIYMNGTNLAVFSKFKLWDPELAGNGLGYPIQKVINFGLNISL